MGAFRRYAFAWCYLGIYVLTEIVYATLSTHAQDALNTWASTSVVNLEHEPIAPLVVSAFIGPGNNFAWPALIALALFSANHALGSARTALICLAGNVIGSLVSEGIVAYRVDEGQLPVSDRHLLDVGPSYVVMSAVVIALICGPLLARIASTLVLVLMVGVGNIFGGLSSLEVAAVGHLTASFTAAACVVLILRHRHRHSDTQGHRHASESETTESGPAPIPAPGASGPDFS
jgi:hypothetical protein